MKTRTLMIRREVSKGKYDYVGAIVLAGTQMGKKDKYIYINPPCGKTMKSSWKMVRGEKIYGSLPYKKFDKTKKCGEERLCKYILLCFGEGFYSVKIAKGGRKGQHSLWRGTITKLFFQRQSSIETINYGLSPYLSSAKPVGSKHYFKTFQ